jgi:hypothetical protein
MGCSTHVDLGRPGSRACFAYVNQGSPLGQDVQHRLDAKAQLIARRNLSRMHEFATHCNAIAKICKSDLVRYAIPNEIIAAGGSHSFFSVNSLG